MNGDSIAWNTAPRAATDEPGTRYWSERMAGRRVVVRDLVVEFDHLGFVARIASHRVGAVPTNEDCSGTSVHLQAHHLRVLGEACDLVALSPAQAKQVPLQRENARRRRVFEDRVSSAIRTARSQQGRWPSVREVQAVLRQRGQPAGRKEKIAALLCMMRPEAAQIKR